MTRLAPLALLPFLSACAVVTTDGTIFIPGLTPEPEVEAPPPLPANVVAALPPGTPPSVVLQDASGCYLFSIEATVPPSGYPLRDAAGNQICAPGAVPQTAPLPPTDQPLVFPNQPVTGGLGTAPADFVAAAQAAGQ